MLRLMERVMTLTIGQLAERAGVNIQTVRYYERRGLLARPPRTRSGYRQYPSDTVDRLRFIKRAKDLGFSLVEITELLALRVQQASACAPVEAKAREKIAVVERKIRELEGMKHTLERLAAACERREPTSECPILEALEVSDMDGAGRPGRAVEDRSVASRAGRQTRAARQAARSAGRAGRGGASTDV